MTTVHLLRHGEVDNPSRVLYGRLPGYHLSARGREMAEVAARELAGRDVVHVVSSPMERAVETAEPVARRFGLRVVVDDRAIEAHNVFEGLVFGVGDGALRRPGAWLYLRNPFLPSWGEPYREVAERMLAVVADARRAADGHEAVVVSHQLPIWTLRRHLEGRRLWHRPDRRQCGLASITSLDYDGERLVGIGYREPAAALVHGRQVPGA